MLVGNELKRIDDLGDVAGDSRMSLLQLRFNAVKHRFHENFGSRCGIDQVNVVGGTGLEPVTSAMSTRRSNQLS